MKTYLEMKNTGNYPPRYRVNVLYRGKERWRYCRTINAAKMHQENAIKKGLSSIISQKKDGKYQPI